MQQFNPGKYHKPTIKRWNKSFFDDGVRHLELDFLGNCSSCTSEETLTHSNKNGEYLCENCIEARYKAVNEGIK